MRRARHILYHFSFGLVPFPVVVLFPLILIIWGDVYSAWWNGVLLGSITLLFGYSFGYLMGAMHRRPKDLNLTVVIATTAEEGLAQHLQAHGAPEEVVDGAREMLRAALVDAARARDEGMGTKGEWTP